MNILAGSFRQLMLSIRALSLLLLSSTIVHAETYTIGIVPQQSAVILARNWAPLLQYLEKNTGLSLRFKTAPTIPEFEQHLARGEYDFAYMNPYHYVVFSQAPGYQALVREKDTRLQGVLVVRKDSKIENISQLAGKGVAFPAPASFAASVLPRIQLKKEGITFTPHFVNSHDSVYYTVARGIYPAGGGVVRTLNSAPPEIREQLRVLWTTDSFTPHAFAVHPKVTEKVRQAFILAMTKMATDPAATEILHNLSLHGWDAANDRDWDDLRKLHVDIKDAPVQH